VTGISPQFDEKKDADILKELRKNTITVDTDIDALIKEGERLKGEIDTILEKVTDKQKRFDEIKKAVRAYCMNQFGDGDQRVAIPGNDTNGF